jgi:hypothetical protein
MRFHVLLACLLTCLVFSALGQTSASDFQTGKIVAVEKLDSQGNTTSGTDSAMSAGVNRFNLSIQLNDAVYLCRAKSASDFDLTWANGKEVQAKTKKNVMYVKRSNGSVAKLNIISTKKPE